MSHAPSAALDARHRAVRAELERSTLDALVVTSLANVLYLTNFTGSAGILVLSRDCVILLTDSRYQTAVRDMRGTPHECPSLELELIEGSYDAKLADVLAAGGWDRVGFEATHLTVSRHMWLVSRLASTIDAGLSLTSTEGIVERGRVIKDEYEVETLREAGRRLSLVAAAVPAEIRAGRTEREVAMAIDWRIRDAGFARTAFDTIVASGPNAALPHARPGERKLAEGDLVVLDFGGVYDSYCVDLTRTVVLGEADARVREVYGAVLNAHDAAIRYTAPGRSRFDIDRAARETLERHRFGGAFGHGTGHGLGIEVHEDPRIVRRRADVDARDEAVAQGMVFTIEPGAYFPGWGGVRIEDDVLVTAGGVEVLTTAPTALMEIR
jgi:Xaa-Pro aminopeptidase